MKNFRISLSVATALVILYLILNWSKSHSPSQPVADVAWVVTCDQPSIAYNQSSGDLSVRVPIPKACLVDPRDKTIRIVISVPARESNRCRENQSKTVEVTSAN
jgi:hypothetical protein